MKEFDPLVFLAVFQEMLGPLLWLLVFLTLTTTLAFLWLLIREKGIVAKRLVVAELTGIIGGILALMIMAKVSSSGFTDAGGPVDWILIALVFGTGLIGGTILVYAVSGWWSQLRPNSASSHPPPHTTT